MVITTTEEENVVVEVDVGAHVEAAEDITVINKKSPRRNPSWIYLNIWKRRFAFDSTEEEKVQFAF